VSNNHIHSGGILTVIPRKREDSATVTRRIISKLNKLKQNNQIGIGKLKPIIPYQRKKPQITAKDFYSQLVEGEEKRPYADNMKNHWHMNTNNNVAMHTRNIGDLYV